MKKLYYKNKGVKMKIKRLTLAIEEELHNNFKMYSIFKRISMSKIISKYIKEVMENEKGFTTAIKKERRKNV